MTSYDPVPQNRLDPEYLAGYGLKEPPFSDEYDERFLYLDRQRRHLFEILERLEQHARLVLLVVGERGIGKSSIKRRFMEHADESRLICDINAHPMMDADELLTNIAQGFGLIDIPVDPSALHESLYSYLAGLRQQGRIPVLLVDDAHELPREALEALFYLADAEAGEGNLLHSILFCEPAIEVMLESSAIQSLQKRITHHLRLSPFDEEQTAEYIRHRLAVAGLEGTSPFSPRDVRNIYESAGGVPEHINRAAHQLLANGRIDRRMEEEPDLEADNPDEAYLNRHKLALMGIVLLVVLLGLGLWWYTGDAGRPGQPDREELPVTIELPVEPVPEKSEISEDDTASPVPEQEVAESPPKPEPTPGPPLRIDSLEPDPVVASDEPRTFTLRGEGFDQDTRLTVEWGNQRKTLLESKVRLVSPSRLDFELTVGSKPQTWELIARNAQSGARDQVRFEVQAAEPATSPGKSEGKEAQQTVRPVAQPAPTKQETGNDLDWLRRQPADHYTLQLLAGRQVENLRVFVKQHDLQDRSVIFETRRNAESWFAVAYGSYADRQSARQAFADAGLPDGIEPWIRRFGDIQASLSEPVAAPVAPRSVPVTDSLRDHAAWLWDQDPAHYTLQLLAGSNQQAVQDFIRRHQLQGQALFYRTLRKDKAWYVVVLGDYTDRASALAAREKLPAALRDNNPWPRPFSDIHADLGRQ